jgi:hypothetical protein
MRRPSCLVVAVCLLTLVLPIAAQLPIGSIGGIAKDPSGRVVPGVKVVATNEHQGSVRETTTNMDGTFTLSTVAPGTYTVVLTATGFSDVRYNHVQVPPGQAITLNTTFHVASQSTIVSVGADTSANVNLSQSMLQGQITSSTIQSLPLNGRNFLELAFLIPGNRPAPTFDPTKTNTLEISSAGGFGRGGNILVDGADNNDEVVGGTLSNFPEDSIESNAWLRVSVRAQSPPAGPTRNL